MQADKKLLFQWSIWFLLGNVLLFWLIGLNYIPTIPWLDSAYLTHYGKSLLKSFAFFTYFGQLGAMALLQGLFFIPLIWLFPKRKPLFILAAVMATLLATLLVMDAMIYKLYRFHLNGVMMDLVIHGLGSEIFGFSWLEYLQAAGIATTFFIIELFYAFWLWRNLNKKCFRGTAKWCVIFIALSLYISYTMLIYSFGRGVMNRVYNDVSRFMPLYTEFLGAILPVKDGRLLIERMTETYLIQPRKASAPLAYPLQPLKFAATKQKLNVVMIVIDAWRFDMLNTQVAPSLAKFAEKSWVFTNHFSGGDATGPGIFSLFYGLPSSYWTAMETQHKGPVLIDEMLKQQYRMGIFGSAPLRLPPFHRTVFQAVPNLQVQQQPAQTAYARDRMVTQKFARFIKNGKTSSQPFFSFLFYDSVHSYCSYKDDLQPLQPVIKNCNRMELTNESDPIPYLNRYKNAVLLVDQEIKQVLTILKTNDLLKNTVVIVTGDHGEEFNENHLNYWGHASNFTRYQTQTPLVVYWPGAKPKTFTHKTSHFDLAPTLMEKLLGCKTPAKDYSVGFNLFETRDRPYLIIGGYSAFGIVEPAKITHVSPTGNLRVEQINGQLIPSSTLNEAVMREAFLDLRRFYKNNHSR
ncbi:MAG: sulfatase-like hydrolase/transferase [Gammaproteobacteria bacterium]